MKIVSKILIGVAVFFALVAVYYAFEKDPFTVLVFAVLAAGCYFLSRRLAAKQPKPQQAAGVPQVYVTKGSSHYHSSFDCPYRGRDYEAMSYKKALRMGLTECGHCKK